MDIFQAIDFITENKAATRFRAWVAVFIAIMALVLSIVSLKNDSLKQESQITSIKINDTWNFYQAKNIRQTSYKLASDALEIEILSDKDLPKSTVEIIKGKISIYKETIQRYEIEPVDGKNDLLSKAKDLELKREQLLEKISYLNYSQVSTIISILLSSIALIKNGKIGYGLVGISLGLILISVILFLVTML